MTQANRFLRFVQERTDRTVRESYVLLRIEDDELIVTHRWEAVGAEPAEKSNLTGTPRTAKKRDSWV